MCALAIAASLACISTAAAGDVKRYRTTVTSTGPRRLLRRPGGARGTLQGYHFFGHMDSRKAEVRRRAARSRCSSATAGPTPRMGKDVADSNEAPGRFRAGTPVQGTYYARSRSGSSERRPPAGRPRLPFQILWRSSSAIAIAGAQLGVGARPVLARELALLAVELGVADLAVLRLLARLQLGAAGSSVAVRGPPAPQRHGDETATTATITTSEQDLHGRRGYARPRSRARRAACTSETRRRLAAAAGQAASRPPMTPVAPPIQIQITIGFTLMRKSTGSSPCS